MSIALEITIEKITTILSTIPEEATCWVAYSGGVDSHLLLYLLSRVKKNLRAVHINHSISAFSDEWERHCKAVCAELNVPIHSEKIIINRLGGESLEACARTRRYEIFANLLGSGDFLLTGHHLNDQAETVLLQLMRGAGIKGLSAMGVEQNFFKGFLLRPFYLLLEQKFYTLPKTTS